MGAVFYDFKMMFSRYGQNLVKPGRPAESMLNDNYFGFSRDFIFQRRRVKIKIAADVNKNRFGAGPFNSVNHHHASISLD